MAEAHPFKRRQGSAALKKKVTFYPKVLIVEGVKTFAIVGSGNLSRPGFRSRRKDYSTRLY